MLNFAGGSGHTKISAGSCMEDLLEDMGKEVEQQEPRRILLIPQNMMRQQVKEW